MRFFGTACLVLLLALSGAAPSRAQLAPIDGPFAVTSAAGSHTSPLLAARPDGSYLVVWTTELGSSRTLSGRFFGPGGSPLGPQFQIAPGPVDLAAIALLPDGGFVTVWDQGSRILGSIHDRDGKVRIPAFQIAEGITAIPAVAADAGGSWMAAWEQVFPGGDQSITARWFRPDGTPATAPVPISGAGSDEFEPGIAALPGGGFLAAWTEVHSFPGDFTPLVSRRFTSAGVPSGPEVILLEGGIPRFLALPGGQGFVAESRPGLGNPELLRLDAAGQPVGPAVRIDDQDLDATGTPVLDAAGRLLLVGTHNSPQLLGQRYDTTLFEPVGATFEIPTAMPAASRPVLASARPGQILMVWEDKGRLFGEILVQGCADPGLGLCLAGGRFKVEVSLLDPQGHPEEAHAVPLRDDTGSFWFFAPSNPELLIKVLDGRSLNGHFWVFYGSLSNVAYDIRVTDTETGESRLYSNPAGTLASRADIRAFPVDPAAPEPAAEALPTPAPTRGVALAATSECHSSDVALCLTSGRQVTVDFVDPWTGESRHARAVPFSSESGAFWFFGEANLEIFVKVLDGTAVNGRVWVFHGALSNVEYTITVRAPGGAEWTYHNPRGRMHSGADTSALPAP